MRSRNFPKRVIKTVGWVLYDNAEDLVNTALTPWLKGIACTVIAKRFGPASSRWLFAKILSSKAIDGAILRGFNVFQNSGAKFALRKGLPDVGQRTMAVENEPHVLDAFDGVIRSGYGKGTKRIVYKGKAILKVAGKAKVTDIEYHVHQADRAGLHYDLAIKDLASNCELFELNIGKGPVKGRYAFVKTDKGYIVGVMKDRGVSLPKPKYNLKQESFLEMMSDPSIKDKYIVERKLDGSLANANIYEDRIVLHSHRDSADSYYDKIPSIEFLNNPSNFFLSKYFFPSLGLHGTVLKVELVHEDGASVVSGILNSSPDNAVNVQAKIGKVKPFVWDIVKYKGKDVSHKPYQERRALFENVVAEIRLFNKNWSVIEKKPNNISAIDFYNSIVADKRGLPWSEGVVVKGKSSIVEDSWFKVKMHDLIDMEILSFREGEGRLSGSLGSIVAQDIQTGNIAVVGTGFNDFQRDWIWDHREMLEGAVIKTKVFEETQESFRAPRFVEFHESKGNNEFGLLMTADVLAGLDNKQEMTRIKHALINR